jgi:hypothetical protein
VGGNEPYAAINSHLFGDERDGAVDVVDRGPKPALAKIVWIATGAHLVTADDKGFNVGNLTAVFGALFVMIGIMLVCASILPLITRLSCPR